MSMRQHVENILINFKHLDGNNLSKDVVFDASVHENITIKPGYRVVIKNKGFPF